MPSRLLSIAMLILTLAIALPFFFVLARVWDNLRASQALGLRWFVSPNGAALPLSTAIQRADWILTALLVLIVVTLLRLVWLLFRGRRNT